MEKFAPDEWQDALVLDAVTRGFEQLGLTLPATRDGLWNLVQGLDLSTEAGRENLAGILALTDGLDKFFDIRQAAFDAEIQALLHIQSLAEGVAASLKALRDRIIGDTSTDEENYNRFKAEADQLVVDLSMMTDADEIAETVAEIERLTGLAWGLLDPEQQKRMGDDFLAFLDGVAALAIDRFGVAADLELADTAFTPEEILTRFNELVTDPLILAAEVQGSAAAKLDAVADKWLTSSGADFGITADGNGDPQIVTNTNPAPAGDTVDNSAMIEDAIRAGMKAGAEAMTKAAEDITNSGNNTAAATVSSARLVAGAVQSIPGRIVVETKQSEFS